jgi:hypothetical protein
MNEAIILIPSYIFYGKIVFNNTKQEVICRLLNIRRMNPNFFIYCKPDEVGFKAFDIDVNFPIVNL